METLTEAGSLFSDSIGPRDLGREPPAPSWAALVGKVGGRALLWGPFGYDDDIGGTGVSRTLTYARSFDPHTTLQGYWYPHYKNRETEVREVGNIPQATGGWGQPGWRPGSLGYSPITQHCLGSQRRSEHSEELTSTFSSSKWEY